MKNSPLDMMPAGRDGRNGNGRKGFGAAVWRLYRGDPVWRGAVDLLFIGTLIMGLVWGVPDIFSGLDKIFPTAAKPHDGGAGAVAAAPAATAASGANFSPAAPTNAVLPALPKPKRVGGDVSRTWLGNPSAADKALYEKAADVAPIDGDQAIGLLKDKAAAADPNAQYLMGVAYINASGRGDAEPNVAKALYWYKEAAALGHPDAQFELGQLYRLGPTGIRIDFSEAVKWYEAAAVNPLNNTGEAENELGRLYESGTRVKRNIQKALVYYEIAAEKGLPVAEANLGALYFNGALGKRDTAQSLAWIQKAAEHGDAGGQHNLALLYLRGTVTGKPDYGQFLKWAGLSADQGSTRAMIELGNFYREGKADFPLDLKMAAKYYRLAALKKDAKAQYLLAQMYELGLGMPLDKIQAYVYYSLSYRDGGFTPAYASLEALKRGMTASELDYAQKMSKALTDSVK